MPCNNCGQPVSQKVMEFSVKQYQKILCMDCQKQFKPEPKAVVPRGWPVKPSFEANQKQRQDGIELTARLRRELDEMLATRQNATQWQIACLNATIETLKAKEINKDQIPTTYMAFLNIREAIKPVPLKPTMEVKVEKIK